MEYIELPEQEIIDLYLSGVSMHRLAEKYGVSRYVITDRLNRHNIPIYKLGFLLRKCKNIEEHYFDVIDTEEKAYFLGLLYADGCNQRRIDNRKHISISLQARDKAILEKFSLAILRSIDLYFLKRRKPNHHDQYRLLIHSSIISDRLNELGCTPRKSLTLMWPNCLTDPELQRHFIRGYFDGDGTIGSYKRKNRKNTMDYRAEIVSTLTFCNSVAEIIRGATQINVLLRPNDPKNNLITTKLYIRGNKQVMRFFDWLYQGATIYLERKYSKYLELKAWTEDVDQRINSNDHHINQYL
jgi:LAGLIDADG-like domain